MIMSRITRATIFIVLASFCFAITPKIQADELVLPVTAQTNGLTLEFPLSNLNGDYTDSHFLTSVQFGKNAPLVVNDKPGLSDNQNIHQEQIVTPVTVTPLPSLLPTQPVIVSDVSTHSAVILQEPASTLILDSLPTPTPTDSPTPTPTKVPIKAPTAVQAVTASIVTQPSNPGGLNADTLFAMVNAHRQSMGLPAFQKDDRACQLAASRAPEIAGEVASGTMHSGLRARNLPYWNTENIISMGTEAGAFNWWIHDTIHREAIEGNYTYSCVACSGNSCAEEFTNFQAK